MDTARFAAPVIRRHLPDPAYRVLLFRSRATCSARERSDIDIGIEESPAPVSRAALAAIHDELEEAPTLYTIEVVDFARTFRRDFAGSQNSRSCCDKSPIAAGGFREAVARLDQALALPKDPIVRDPAVRDFVRAMLEVSQGVLRRSGFVVLRLKAR